MVKSIEEQFQDDLGLNEPTPAIETLPDPDVLVHEQPRIGGDAGDIPESQEIGGPPASDHPLVVPDSELLQQREDAAAMMQAGQDRALEPNPLMMLSQALERGVDVEKLERLFDLAERHEKEVQRKSFAAALSDFQGDCPQIVENRTAYVNTSDGGSYSYTYADLDAIMATIRPTLKATGLSVTYDTEIAEDGRAIKSLCYIMHRDGHTEVRTFVCPVDEKLKINDSQKVGSANAYASRYNVQNALGLTTGDDDDGAGGDITRGAPPPTKATDIDEFFPIGKHKGERWDAVPLDYLEWAVANLTEKPDIVERAQAQIDARMDSDNIPPADDGEPTMAECARGITNAKSLEELEQTWSIVPDKHRDGLAAFHATRTKELG